MSIWIRFSSSFSSSASQAYFDFGFIVPRRLAPLEGDKQHLPNTKIGPKRRSMKNNYVCLCAVSSGHNWKPPCVIYVINLCSQPIVVSALTLTGRAGQSECTGEVTTYGVENKQEWSNPTYIRTKIKRFLVWIKSINKLFLPNFTCSTDSWLISVF